MILGFFHQLAREWLLLVIVSVTAFFPVFSSAETVLITGSNSGIGLEFAEQYAAKGWTVIATHRRDRAPETLVDLSAKYPDRIRIERMDVTRHHEIDALAEKLKGTPIDILLNNAGVVFLGDIMDPETRKAQEFGTLEYDQFDTFMHTNALGPLKIAEAFIDHVKAGDKKMIVNISSAAGTITREPRYPGAIWYKASKTALNSFMVNLAHELKDDGVTVVMFHPGFVRVEKLEDMDAPGMIEPETSISGMIDVIEELTLEDSGRFLKHTGEPQPF